MRYFPTVPVVKRGLAVARCGRINSSVSVIRSIEFRRESRLKNSNYSLTGAPRKIRPDDATRLIFNENKYYISLRDATLIDDGGWAPVRGWQDALPGPPTVSCRVTSSGGTFSLGH